MRLTLDETQQGFGGSALCLLISAFDGNGTAGLAAGVALGAGLSRGILAAYRVATPSPSTQEIEKLQHRRSLAGWEALIAKADRDDHPAVALEPCFDAPSSEAKSPS